LTFREKVVIGFSASAILVVLVAVTSAAALKAALASDHEAYRQAEELIAIEPLRAALERRVASFRGYLLTGEDDFLGKLQRGRVEVLSRVRRLRQTASGKDAALLAAIEQADLGYEEAAGEGLALRSGGATPEQLGRYIEMTTGPRREVLDRAIGTFLAHKHELLREAQQRSETENLWASIAILATGGGALLLLTALAIPVTRTLASLYETEHRERARKSAVLESALEAIITMDADGEIVEFNPAAERIFGYFRSEAIGRPMADLIIPERLRSAHHAGLARHLATGETKILGRRLEMPAVRGDGTEFPAELTITRIPSDPVFFTGFVRDLSDLKAAERERTELLARERRARADAEAAATDNARLYREAQEAIAVREDFLSIASHELKTPLTTLQLQVQRLLRRGEAETSLSPNGLSALERQVNRLTGLINDLLDISRITGGRMELEREEVDLAAVVRDVVARQEEDRTRARCPITVAIDRGSLGLWDRLRIEQVVSNLLSNAIKYGAGQPIEVSVDGDAEFARLTVRDHGIGIAPEHQVRIFQRFERAVSKSNYGGFGLGLWIVRQIVEAHGGMIHVASEPQRGSTFCVELPRSGGVSSA
jgi:PAS domain S-box-containing protein